jgi:hypothetical protein
MLRILKSQISLARGRSSDSVVVLRVRRLSAAACAHAALPRGQDVAVPGEAVPWRRAGVQRPAGEVQLPAQHEEGPGCVLLPSPFSQCRAAGFSTFRL